MTGRGRPVEVANRHPSLKVDRPGIRRALRLLDGEAPAFLGGCPMGELSIAFMTDPELAGLHGRFLDDPAPTDVITFQGAAPGVAGEVCISVDAAVRTAGRGRLALSRELTLYMVHGCLHLAGYDDLEPVARRAMRRAEKRALAVLERRGAVPRFVLA
jgi:probable rRNA maturation factor